MNLVMKIVAATILTGALASTGFSAVQAGNCSAVTPAFQQDEDLLTPEDRILCRNPHLYPGWTWMTERQAIILLKATGFSEVLRLEKAGSSWRGKAVKDHLSYHVAIDRYTRVVAHLDKKSREQQAAAQHTAMTQGSQ
jgi:hypothetical protein